MTRAMTSTVIPWRSISATTIKTIKFGTVSPTSTMLRKTRINPAAIIGRDKGERRSDRHTQAAGDQADAQSEQRAARNDREQIAALPVAAKGERPGRRLQGARRKRPGVLRIDK